MFLIRLKLNLGARTFWAAKSFINTKYYFFYKYYTIIFLLTKAMCPQYIAKSMALPFAQALEHLEHLQLAAPASLYNHVNFNQNWPWHR